MPRLLAAAVFLALAAQALIHEGALLLRPGNEPEAPEAVSLPGFVGREQVTVAASGTAPDVELVAPLPADWAAFPALVYVEGARVPFKRPKAPGSEGRDIAYYRRGSGGLDLVVRLAVARDRASVLALRQDWRVAPALAGLRLARQPRRLAVAAAWTLAAAILLLAGAPWRRPECLPPLLTALALVAWTTLGGLAGTWWSPVSGGACLLLVSLPLLEPLAAAGRTLGERLTARARTILAAAAAVGLLTGCTCLAWRLFRAYLALPEGDHAFHLGVVRTLVDGGPLQPHPGYHFLVALAAGFSRDAARIATAAAAVLTALVLAKLALSVGLAADLARRAGDRLGAAAALVLAAVLFTPQPWPAPWRPDDVYLGQLSGAVWHNPTSVALAPLAVAAFWLLLRLGRTVAAPAVALAVVLALSTLVKPNFTLAVLPVLGLLVVMRRLPLRVAFVCALPALATLAWQLARLAAGPQTGEGVVSVRPLAAWHLYSPAPLVSILLSLAFPIAVTLLVWRDERHREALRWSWLLAGVAVLEMALLSERGARFSAFNFYWGVVPAVHLLFLTAALELLAARGLTGGRRGCAWCCWVLLLLHEASGAFGYCHPFQMPAWSCGF